MNDYWRQPAQPGQDNSFYAQQARHVRQCWREAKLIGWVWLASLLVVGGSIGSFGYLPASERPAVPVLVWGIPAWVFWGLLVPWIVLIGITWWFAICFLKDDEPLEEMVGDQPFPGADHGVAETVASTDDG